MAPKKLTLEADGNLHERGLVTIVAQHLPLDYSSAHGQNAASVAVTNHLWALVSSGLIRYRLRVSLHGAWIWPEMCRAADCSLNPQCFASSLVLFISTLNVEIRLCVRFSTLFNFNMLCLSGSEDGGVKRGSGRGVPSGKGGVRHRRQEPSVFRRFYRGPESPGLPSPEIGGIPWVFD